MGIRQKEASHAELERARRRFDRWRQTHKGRRRIPEPLWNVAVKVASTCGVSKTASALRIDYTGLKRRVATTASSRDSIAAVETTFLELAAPVSSGQRRCVVQMEDCDGAKMRMELSGVETRDLLALSRTFWRAERCSR